MTQHAGRRRVSELAPDHVEGGDDELRINLGGWSCCALASGPTDGPLVVAVHGFPDTARTFDSLRSYLAKAGFYVVAPFTRGVPPSGAAPDGDYGTLRLADDIRALVHQLGRRRAHIVGHDWGAIAAYLTAAFHPEVVDRMVAAAVPPPRTWVTNPSIRQLRKSWYMGFFQLPLLPERRLVANDFALLRRLWADWSPGWVPGAATVLPPSSSAFSGGRQGYSCMKQKGKVSGSVCARLASLRRPASVLTSAVLVLSVPEQVRHYPG